MCYRMITATGNEPTSRRDDMWTQDNNGFTDAQLKVINDAIALIDTDGIDESNVNDAINNAWIEQDTAADLAAAASKLLGR